MSGGSGTISARRKTGQAIGKQGQYGACFGDVQRSVRLSFLTSLLADAGIAAILLDGHTSAVEGSIGAIPRRLAVATEDEGRARQVLKEAGEI
jgi:hypothetical protein